MVFHASLGIHSELKIFWLLPLKMSKKWKSRLKLFFLFQRHCHSKLAEKVIWKNILQLELIFDHSLPLGTSAFFFLFYSFQKHFLFFLSKISFCVSRRFVLYFVFFFTFRVLILFFYIIRPHARTLTRIQPVPWNSYYSRRTAKKKVGSFKKARNLNKHESHNTQVTLDSSPDKRINITQYSIQHTVNLWEVSLCTI